MSEGITGLNPEEGYIIAEGQNMPIVTSPDPRGELYTRVIEVNRAPKAKPTRQGNKTRVEFLDETRITVNDVQIPLEDHELFAFNALMLKRDGLSSTQDLAELGFDPQVDLSELGFAINGLASLMQGAVNGEEPVQQQPKRGKDFFMLNPNLALLDGRALRDNIVRSIRPPGMQGTWPDYTTVHGFVGFEGNAKEKAAGREQAIISIVKKYQAHPAVEANIEAAKVPIKSQKLFDEELDYYRRTAGQFMPFDYGEQNELFKFIERGLAAYQRLGGEAGLASASLPESLDLIGLTAARQLLFLTNQRLVVTGARKYIGRSQLTFAELIQEGNIGLSKAISRYDYTGGTVFYPFALTGTDFTIQRAMANIGRTIRMPVHLNTTWINLLRQERELSRELGGSPTHEELSLKSGLPLDEVRLIMKTGSEKPISLDLLVPNARGKDDSPLVELLPDPKTKEAMSIASQIDTAIHIKRIFDGVELDDREKLVLALRHGAYDSIPEDLLFYHRKKLVDYRSKTDRIITNDNLTFKDIAKILGVSDMSVGNWYKDALSKAAMVLAGKWEVID